VDRTRAALAYRIEVVTSAMMTFRSSNLRYGDRDDVTITSAVSMLRAAAKVTEIAFMYKSFSSATDEFIMTTEEDI
jgi:hypothetical protein